MGIKYYKKWLEEEKRYQYEERNSSADDASMTEISRKEYETETAKQWEEYIVSLPAEEPADTPSYDELLEKTAELEKENAALLFQVLTGEEYADA